MRETANAMQRRDPPPTWWGALRFLGPGVIVAAAIVGSGELVATTKTGAEAGFALLWLILVGCVIKVFVQVELGRYAVQSGKPTMTALAEVPFGRVGRRGNLIVWFWCVMFAGSVGQLGGIVGGVGQALAIAWPITEEGRLYNDMQEARLRFTTAKAALRLRGDVMSAFDRRAAAREQDDRARAWRRAERQWKEAGAHLPADDKYWAVLIAIVTAAVLFAGHYGTIQWLSAALVAAFMAVSLVNLVLLQMQPLWRITWSEWWSGFAFALPEPRGEARPVATALATFGIIGVGATELIAYPYWCLERGYGRYTGPSDGSEAWYGRAQGWLRVMRIDAWCSMVVYTTATMVFYLLGAAVLGRAGLNPEKQELIRTLSAMYEPVFGRVAVYLFLAGALAVLYSTFFVANAANARMLSDALGVIGWADPSSSAHRRRVRWMSGGFPLLCAVIYVAFPQPAALILLSGLLQALMLPILAACAIYFRFARTPAPLAPGRLWDAGLVVSALGMLLAAIWAIVVHLP